MPAVLQGRLEELTRSRLSTVRARMMYAVSLAFSPGEHSVFTVGVPNARTRRLVVSRFDLLDWTLAEEFVPQLATGDGPALKEGGRSLDEYCVTGATVVGRELIALSSAYSTLLIIDLPRRALTAAYALPGLDRPSGVAFKGGELYVVSEGGTVSVFDSPVNPQ